MVIRVIQLVSTIDAQLGAKPLVQSAFFMVVPYNTTSQPKEQPFPERTVW